MLYSPCLLVGLLKSERAAGYCGCAVGLELLWGAALGSWTQFIQGRRTVVDPVESPVQTPEQKPATDHHWIHMVYDS